MGFGYVSRWTPHAPGLTISICRIREKRGGAEGEVGAPTYNRVSFSFLFSLHIFPPSRLYIFVFFLLSFRFSVFVSAHVSLESSKQLPHIGIKIHRASSAEILFIPIRYP